MNNIQKCIGFHMFQNLLYIRRRRMMITIRANCEPYYNVYYDYVWNKNLI